MMASDATPPARDPGSDGRSGGDRSSDSGDLRRELGLWTALTIGAGTTTGAGIFLLAGGVLRVLVERDGSVIVPEAETEFRAGDRLTFPGTEEKIEALHREYRRS